MKPLSTARQWSRAAWVLAVLFASLPLAGRLVLGAWAFPGATEIAFLCLILGTYLHFLGRRHSRTLRDDAAVLERALELAANGQTSGALALLTETIRRSPRLWQAYQYRAQLYSRQNEFLNAAVRDLTEAIHLAPKEPHLYLLRGQVHRQLGDERSARADSEAAAALGARPA